jgi:large subunit ribosomal protein L20
MTKNRLYKVAREADIHAGQYAYVGRKNRKRDFRRLWITRINGALAGLDMTYSKFIDGLKKVKIEIDRKKLSELVVDNPEVFKKIATMSKKGLDK